MMRSVALAICLAACGFHSSLLQSGPPDATVPDGGSPDAAPPPDATVPPDAMIPDPNVVLRIEAEQFSMANMTSAHRWAPATDEPGFSSDSFVQCLPADGASCIMADQVATCSASLVYDLVVTAQATLFFQARMLAHTGNDDSIWYSVDGTPLTPTELTVTSDGSWHWSTGVSFTTDVGLHRLRIWQRECGARVDVIALTLTATPPQ